MADKLTEAQLASLTEEEREGLLEDEGEDEDEDEEEGGDDETDASGADGKDDDADAASDVVADPVTVGDGTGAAAAPDPKTDAASPAAAASDADPEIADTEPEKTPAWVLPGDFDDRIKQVKADRANLAKQFDDGDLTAGELQEQLQALDETYDGLREQKIKANISYDAARETFGSAVSDFLAKNPQYAKGSALYGLLDAQVRSLQSGAANPLNPALIAKAHAKIDADLRKALGVTEAPAAAKTDAKAGGKAAAAKRPDPPPTLRGMPAADMEDVGDGGEFAALERLADKDSVAHERAMADLKKRDPAAFDRYMQQ